MTRLTSSLNRLIFRVLFLLLILVSGTVSSLRADSFGIRLGYWSTPAKTFYTSDLENRFFRDDLLRGTNNLGVVMDQWDFPLSSMKRYTYPIEMYYIPGRFQDLRLEAGGDSVKSNVKGNGLALSGNQIQFLAMDRYQGWRIQEYHAGAALYFLNPERKRETIPLLLAFRAGGIRMDRSFGFNSLLLGDGVYGLKNADEPWNSHAEGGYYGLELGYLIDSAHLTIYGRHDRSDALHGSFSYGDYTFVMNQNGVVSRITQDRMAGDVRTDRRLYEAGVRYHITPDFSFTLAYRTEEFRTSYPDYRGYTLEITQGAGINSPVNLNVSVSEFLMDSAMVYGERKTESRGGILFAMEKRFDY